MKSKWSAAYRLTAATLITSMISINMAGNIYAGPPAVSVDETLYVYLDYYGKETDSSVVKGVTLNGIRSFSDYGTYKDITNMSNYAKPAVDGDTVPGSFRRMQKTVSIMKAS